MKKLIIVLLILSICAFSVSALRIAVLGSATTGDMGGVSGGDSLCQAEFGATYPGTTWKALLYDNASGGVENRYAGGTAWVMEADTNYTRIDGTTNIGKTDSTGCLQLDLDNYVNNGSMLYETWTGFFYTSTCTSKVGDYTCNYWTNSSNSYTGIIGLSTDPGISWLYVGQQYDCGYANVGIYCVEQPPPPPPVPEFSTITIILAALVAIGGVVVMRRRF